MLIFATRARAAEGSVVRVTRWVIHDPTRARCQEAAAKLGLQLHAVSDRRILVTEGVRRQRLALAN